eukprot:1834732-Alexandrium_andersonii.AAC.1
MADGEHLFHIQKAGAHARASCRSVGSTPQSWIISEGHEAERQELERAHAHAIHAVPGHLHDACLGHAGDVDPWTPCEHGVSICCGDQVDGHELL